MIKAVEPAAVIALRKSVQDRQKVGVMEARAIIASLANRANWRTVYGWEVGQWEMDVELYNSVLGKLEAMK